MSIRIRGAAVVAALTLATGGAGRAQEAPSDDTVAGRSADAPRTARAHIVGRERATGGEAIFSQGPGGVLIRLRVTNLPVEMRNAWHGVHLHETGDCSRPDFTSAGRHINPSGRAHGLLNPAGPDNADLPNIWVDAAGNVHVELYTTRVSLNGENGQPDLLDADGAALVIHAGSDDHETQPIGQAGVRIACAEIRPLD